MKQAYQLADIIRFGAVCFIGGFSLGIIFVVALER